MLSAKSQPICLGLNVLIEAESKLTGNLEYEKQNVINTFLMALTFK